MRFVNGLSSEAPKRYPGRMELDLEATLKGRVKVVWAELEGLHHQEDPGFRGYLDAICSELFEKYGEARPSEIERLAPARELYRATGTDPTRYRPSSEALLRRVLRGKRLYRLDPIVDTGNLFSLVSGLPLGLYDRSTLRGSILLRLGRQGEGYRGIRKDWVNVGGRLCLADEEGPFGSPTSDSQRCRVRESSTKILFILYAPASVDERWLRERGEELSSSFRRWNGGEVVASGASS